MLIALLAIVAVVLFYSLPQQAQQNLLSLISSSVPSNLTNALENATPISISYTTSVPPSPAIPQSKAYQYALEVINRDRQAFNLTNVTFSNETSGQQHSGSMLKYDYFSHWDIYGLKPYMRYTLLGGLGSVSENIAYEFNSSGVDVYNAISRMEYSMMYNDSACCNNGHRYNILDPMHNQVSIGVAYNATTIYFTEDFINSYITWLPGSPSVSGDSVNLFGYAQSGYALSGIFITYDRPLVNMTAGALANTTDYGYGQNAAGIGYRQGNEVHYYSNMMTINASRYILDRNAFNVSFSIANAIAAFGPGEYTIMMCISKGQAAGGTCVTSFDGTNAQAESQNFVAATYTLFVNQSNAVYSPKTLVSG